MQQKSGTLLVWIGIFKLIKAALLVATGVGALKLVGQDASHTIREWLRQARVDPDDKVIHSILARLDVVTPGQLRGLGIGTFVYAALFLVEGVGLVLRKRWAEFVTIGVTGALLPLEVYELVQKLTVVRVIVLVLNVAIVVYLIARLRAGKKRVTRTTPVT